MTGPPPQQCSSGLLAHHEFQTCFAAVCQSLRILATSPGLSKNLVRAVSAVVWRASLESRLKNCVISFVSCSSLMPFCTSGENFDESTSGEVGRLEEPEASMKA